VSGIEKEKTFAPFYDFLFTYYSGQKSLAKAEEILKLKSANNPKNASYILQIAAYYYLSNQKPESQRQLERLLSNSADFPNANILVGDFYFRVRDLDKAKAHYEKGI